MKDITIIIFGKENLNYGEVPNNLEIVRIDIENIKEKLKGINTKYISFIKSDDIISDDYFNLISVKVKEDFDCCYINYTLDCVDESVKLLTSEKELLCNKPYYGGYIWNYIYKTDIFIELFKCNDKNEFNKLIDIKYVKMSAIGKIVYIHKINGVSLLNYFCYRDIRKTLYLKNVIYVGNGCNCTFNGYVSWVKNIGRCFSDKFDITILYDNIPDETLKLFSKYFNCIKYDLEIDYLCKKLLLTYSTYYYKKNIFTLNANYMFIHGNMCDYPNSKHFYDDIYTKYIGVSEVSAKKAKGYFPTDKIDYIINPFKIDSELVKPHLKLVSAQRSAYIKRLERIEILASVFDELDIPYTWNVFTDKNENTNKNGVVYRRRLANPLSYVEDADYFVLLSDSEALSYGVLEALSLNTKVIVTPLEAFNELGVVDGENGFIIPFEYFDANNKEKLMEIVKKIYANKDKKINYKFDESLFARYNDLFIK